MTPRILIRLSVLAGALALTALAALVATSVAVFTSRAGDVIHIQRAAWIAVAASSVAFLVSWHALRSGGGRHASAALVSATVAGTWAALSLSDFHSMASD